MILFRGHKIWQHVPTEQVNISFMLSTDPRTVVQNITMLECQNGQWKQHPNKQLSHFNSHLSGHLAETRLWH